MEETGEKKPKGNKTIEVISYLKLVTTGIVEP